MTITIDQFVEKYIGKKVDFDGAYGGQCVDLYRQYIHDVLGFPQTPTVKGACNIYDNCPDDKFDKIVNTPVAVPEKGDIIIWNSHTGGGFGHVAIYLEGDINAFTSLDQNWPTLSKVTKTKHTYSHVLGWLRPKKKADNYALIQGNIIKAHNIIKRRDWGAITPKYNKMTRDWDYDSIVIHHSGNHGAKDPKEIEKKHMEANNFDDIGYHYMIHPSGIIYEAREIIYKGSHVRNANTHKIGILMMGDYDQQFWDFDDDDLSLAHLQKLKDFIKTLTKNFLKIKYLGGHLEFAEAQGDERTCPGNLLIAELDGLRKEFALNAPTKA